MAEIRCPNCGKNNPDILDVCQFCQTPLKPDSVLRIGDQPTKKNTGELETVLPEWLRDVRQQARSSAEEEAENSPSLPQSRKEEPPDLLAGLASQAGGDEEEVPDWLTGLNQNASPKSETPPAPSPAKDFFAQLRESESEGRGETAHHDMPAWTDRTAEQPAPSASEENDELSEWFVQAAEQPEETVELDPHAGQDDRGWLNSFERPASTPEEPAPKEAEDLSWLRDLEEAARQTGDLKSPRKDIDWTGGVEIPPAPAGSSSQNDLSWLDNLGGIEEPVEQAAEPPRRPEEDLSWLDQLGAMPGAETHDAVEEPSRSPEDLSWLNNLGAAAEQPFDAAPDRPVEPQPFVPEQDLSWLNNLGQASEASQPGTGVPESPAEEDLSWLKGLGSESELPAEGDLPKATTPRQTAPLGQPEDQKEPEPDWLKSAAEAPSMPAPGDVSMDWFSQQDQSEPETGAPPAGMPSTPQPAPFEDIFSPPGEPAPLSDQDVDSLFSVEMPDWLSQPEPGAREPDSRAAAPVPAPGEDSLTPVELPSWVQAMRPVEAAISEAEPGLEDQPEETEGPLAGLRGVIPGAPIGSVRRPRPVALKLQATDEQQASAALLEQILSSETTPRALISSTFVASQHFLRWTLAALLLLVLGAMISLRSQSMPVSTGLSPEASSLSGAVLRIPAGANVLVVIDYEPSLAGEMEAVGGPLLDQMVLLGQPNLSFISTSPNGTALVERLLSRARINTPDGFDYREGEQYRNLGFLPGGSTGVLGFMERPDAVIPGAGAGAFSEYAALVIMTDHAESARVWVEQLQNRKEVDPLLSGQPLLMVASAQAGPLLQPYVSSGQVAGLLSGLSEAARYEANNNRPGLARLYWDTFGIGLALSIALIVVGGLWNLVTGIRARRAEVEQG